MTETFLGDGLYCSYDGVYFKLRTPRDGGDHEVYLDPNVLGEFLAFVEEVLHGKSKKESV